MPITITPNSSAYPGDSDVRVDGEVASASFLNSETLQPYLNGIAAARTGLYGGRTRRSYRCTVPNTAITIDPLGALTLTSGSGTIWHTVFHGAPTVLSPFGNFLDAGIPANHTRYYIYATTNGSTVGFVISTLTPDATLSYQSSTTDRLYVGTFVTDGSANIKEFTCSGGLYMYHLSAGNTGSTLPGVLLGSSTTLALLNLDQVSNRGVPAYARFAVVQVNMNIPAGQDLIGGAQTYLVHPDYPALAGSHFYFETIGSFRSVDNLANRSGRSGNQGTVAVSNSTVLYRVTSASIQATIFAIGFLDS